VGDARSLPKLRVTNEPVAAASEELRGALSRVLAEREIVRLAIPGGSALAALPEARARLGGDWARIALTWVDERCVPEDDEESNRGAAARLGLLEDPTPACLLRLYEDGESPAQAVARASTAIRTVFEGALDVSLLGMGEDGHVASLFPSSPWLTEDSVAYIGDSPKPPASRITLTRALLGTAQHAILLATGEAKRAALTRLLAGDPQLPAHELPGLVVVTDLEVPDRHPSSS
jgi:6-phosphogluconolactonase